jgi:hypothetical protein
MQADGILARLNKRYADSKIVIVMAPYRAIFSFWHTALLATVVSAGLCFPIHTAIVASRCANCMSLCFVFGAAFFECKFSYARFIQLTESQAFHHFVLGERCLCERKLQTGVARQR